MTTGTPTPSVTDWSQARDEQDVASETKLPLDVIRFCVRKGIVHPRQTEGRLLFPPQDVLHLKLFRCILYARHLSRELERCWRKAGEDAMAESKALGEKFPRRLIDTAEEALRNFHPIA